MPELAKLVTLDLAQKKLYIDGVEFPWLTSVEGPQFNNLADTRSIRSVTLTFFTEDVEIIPEGAEKLQGVSDACDGGRGGSSSFGEHVVAEAGLDDMEVGA